MRLCIINNGITKCNSTIDRENLIDECINCEHFEERTYVVDQKAENELLNLSGEFIGEYEELEEIFNQILTLRFNEKLPEPVIASLQVISNNLAKVLFHSYERNRTVFYNLYFNYLAKHSDSGVSA